jgi:hypothetical protein
MEEVIKIELEKSGLILLRGTSGGPRLELDRQTAEAMVEKLQKLLQAKTD